MSPTWAARLSRTIVQGSFEKGHIFFAKYLVDVDGPVVSPHDELGARWTSDMILRGQRLAAPSRKED